MLIWGGGWVSEFTKSSFMNWRKIAIGNDFYNFFYRIVSNMGDYHERKIKIWEVMHTSETVIRISCSFWSFNIPSRNWKIRINHVLLAFSSVVLFTSGLTRTVYVRRASAISFYSISSEFSIEWINVTIEVYRRKSALQFLFSQFFWLNALLRRYINLELQRG